ncbi:MAG TPA: hypothetical protein VJT09_16495, partial [Pyrinomonadaceae bacterium]|nr:hypothetical protein [Pyrinomonadaceae bacterium]
ITGTGGAGFLQIANQSSAPATPTSAGRLFFDNSGQFNWLRSDGFTRTFSSTITANRIYTWPDADITVAGINRAQTFSTTQTITPGTNVAALKINPSGSQTVNLIEVTSDGTNIRFRLDSAGRIGSRGAHFGNNAESATLSYDAVLFGATAVIDAQATGSFIRLSANANFGFNSSNNNPNGSAVDTKIERHAAGIFGLTSSTIKLGDPGTKPTCDATNRGVIWHDYGGAGVKDTVEVCAKDAGDVYAWRTIY